MSSNMVISQGGRRCKIPLSRKRTNQPRPEIAVKIHKTPIEIETLLKTYHDIDMLQSLRHYIFLCLPSRRVGRITARLPNRNQTHMTQAGDAHEMVNEVEGWPPAEVLVGRVATASLRIPVGWHLISATSLCLDVGRGGGFLPLGVD